MVAIAVPHAAMTMTVALPSGFNWAVAVAAAVTVSVGCLAAAGAAAKKQRPEMWPVSAWADVVEAVAGSVAVSAAVA